MSAPASTAACAKSFNRRVGGAFTTTVILHVLWDTFASMRSATFVGFVSIEFVSLLIALVSLTLLIRRVREARRAAEIVGDGGGVTREYAGPSPYTLSSSPGTTYTSGGGRRETDRLWPDYGYPDLRTERKGPGDA
jgi:hypothetical protein